jgi:hypothetical protein
MAAPKSFSRSPPLVKAAGCLVEESFELLMAEAVKQKKSYQFIAALKKLSTEVLEKNFGKDHGGIIDL